MSGENKFFEKEKNEQIVEIANANKKDLNDVLRLEKTCFPDEWQYENPEEYYRKMLNNSENINFFLKEGDKVIGYTLAKPRNTMIADLKEIDPEFKNGEGYYIETIQIHPNHQGRGGARKLLMAICREAIKRGEHKFSIHARTLNGFHDKIKKIFEGKIVSVRKIEKWQPAQGEPYEHIEWEY